MADQNNSSSDLAAEVIRQKINSMYVQGNIETREPNAVQERNEVEQLKHRSNHQEYMHKLTSSGKTLAQIQTEWHNYYINLRARLGAFHGQED